VGGYSFGGNAGSGVADRRPQRIRQLVYLDAIMLQSGQSMFDQLSPEVVQARLKAAQASGGLSIDPPPAEMFGLKTPEQVRDLASRLTPHPLGTYTSPLKLRHPIGHDLPAVYIQCTDPVFAGLQSSRDWVRASGMTTVEFKTGHDAMITAPDALADLLLALARRAD